MQTITSVSDRSTGKDKFLPSVVPDGRVMYVGLFDNGQTHIPITLQGI